MFDVIYAKTGVTVPPGLITDLKIEKKFTKRMSLLLVKGRLKNMPMLSEKVA
jgi:hypothetical protein